MGDIVDIFFRNTFHNSRNHNAVRDRGNYGKTAFLSTSSNGNDLGRSVPTMGALYNEDGFRGGDELSRPVKLPCQNAINLNRQNNYDGSEPYKPPINSEFDGFDGKREDSTIHVWCIHSHPGTNSSDNLQQLANCDDESKDNSGTPMVLSERSSRLRSLSSQLGPLLGVNSLEGNARAETKLCHLVIPNDRPKIWKNEDDASMCQVSAGDEIDGVPWYRNNFPMVVETIMKSNRCHIAKSLGFKLYDEDQEDYINYIKEEMFGYIEEVKGYGFDHIIIIGELNYGLLFLDCFGRAFNLDSMTSTVLFLGDYFERVEKVSKGLRNKWVPWMVDPDGGNVVEAIGPEHYFFPVEKKRMEKMKKKKKKSSKKKHH